MHLEIEQPSEEVQTRFHLALAAIGDRLVHELFRLQHFIKLDVLVHVVPAERVGIAAHHRDDLQAIWVLVARELTPSFGEEFTCHQIILMIHAKNAFAEPLVICGCCVNFAILGNPLNVLLCQLILFDRNVTIGTEVQDLMNQVITMSFIGLAQANINCGLLRFIILLSVLFLVLVFVDKNFE